MEWWRSTPTRGCRSECATDWRASPRRHNGGHVPRRHIVLQDGWDSGCQTSSFCIWPLWFVGTLSHHSYTYSQPAIVGWLCLRMIELIKSSRARGVTVASNCTFTWINAQVYLMWIIEQMCIRSFIMSEKVYNCSLRDTCNKDRYFRMRDGTQEFSFQHRETFPQELT